MSISVYPNIAVWEIFIFLLDKVTCKMSKPFSWRVTVGEERKMLKNFAGADGVLTTGSAHA